MSVKTLDVGEKGRQRPRRKLSVTIAVLRETLGSLSAPSTQKECSSLVAHVIFLNIGFLGHSLG